MTDLERLTEALKQPIFPPGTGTQGGAVEAAWIDNMHMVHRAARAYRDLLANPAEPDLDQAAKTLWQLLTTSDQRWNDVAPMARAELYDKAAQVVHDAVGGRLLIERPEQ